MKIIVDRFAEFDCKSGKGLRFNMLVQVGKGYMSGLGFRLWGGALWPPQTPDSARRIFYDVNYLDETVALGLYDAVAAELEASGLSTRHGLATDRKKAIAKLLMNGREGVYFPSLVESEKSDPEVEEYGGGTAGFPKTERNIALLAVEQEKHPFERWNWKMAKWVPVE